MIHFNMTLNATTLGNFSSIYPIDTIINQTTAGNFMYFVTAMNATLNYWPMRLFVYALFFILTALGKNFLPQTPMLKIVSVSAFISAILIGLSSFTSPVLLNPLEAMPFVVTAGLSAWITSRD